VRQHAPARLWRSQPVFKEVVTSTQDEVKRPEFPFFTPLVAAAQTAGRGRRGNRWFSPAGGGLYLSFKLPKSFLKKEDPSPLALVLGLAVSRAVDGYVLSRIKWPNDVYVGNKKVAGILIEGGPSALVAGIGVNLNTPFFPPELKKSATSLFLETGEKVDFEEFTRSLLESLEEEILLYREEGFKPFVERINRKLLWRNKRVLIDRRECGKLLGVDEGGRAVVMTCFKELKRLPYGELSLRAA